jgi:hypothetical protein
MRITALSSRSEASNEFCRGDSLSPRIFTRSTPYRYPWFNGDGVGLRRKSPKGEALQQARLLRRSLSYAGFLLLDEENPITFHLN